MPSSSNDGASPKTNEDWMNNFDWTPYNNHDWLGSIDQGTTSSFQFPEIRQDLSLEDTRTETPGNQPQLAQGDGLDAQTRELRIISLLTKGRLDDMERVILRIDASMARVEALVSKVDAATGEIRAGLQKFSNDVIDFLRSCGLHAHNQRQHPDEEMGINE
ncbi:hypothetical protein F4678DRAFT_456719 [Xylaria arbuscula]|nr:hypothetical protein F4678DRAFT_456719 [Xylaria arbuscula]